MFAKVSQGRLLQPKSSQLLQDSDKLEGEILLKQALSALSTCDYEQAYDKLCKAVKQHGNVESLVHIGYMHEKGYKYPHDLQLAIDYYKLAAKLHVPSASRHLGMLALDGKKISETNNDAKRFLDISHAQGDKELIKELLLRGMRRYYEEQTQAPPHEE